MLYFSFILHARYDIFMLYEIYFFNFKAFFESNYLDIPTPYRLYYYDPILLEKYSYKEGTYVLVKLPIQVFDEHYDTKLFLLPLSSIHNQIQLSLLYHNNTQYFILRLALYIL